MAIVLWGAGCGRTSSEYGQFPPNAEGLSLAGLRLPAGDTTRLLRNAHYLKLMGRSELALRELEAAYQQDPTNIRVLNTLSLACDEMGEFSRAQKLYHEALALDVSNQALNNNLCFSYYLAGQWDKAEACFRQALTRNPNNIMARNNLGLLLCRRGRTEEARRLWQENEGEIAAQKKMQQVMVALGLGEPSHYAQLPQSPPVAAAPRPENSTPPAPVAQDTKSAKAPWLSPPEPKPQVPAAPPAKAQEPLKLAVNPPPAAQPDKKTPALIAAAKPAPPPEAAPAVKKQSEPVAPKPASAQTAAQKKPAPQAVAAPPTKAQSPPAPPKQAADFDKKPAPASTPPPPSKPGKIKLSAPAAPKMRVTAEKQAQSGIEVLNGSGAYKLAHQTRTLLKEEGFKVVSIGNHRDFGAENTVIYYRPGTEEVARTLSAKFFPKSRLETGEKFAKDADIKIILGKDAVTPSAVAEEPAPAAEKIAANHPVPKPAPASAPAPAAAQAKAPAPAPMPVSSAATAKAVPQEPRDRPYLTASELETMTIDIRNGTPVPDLARKTRSMLAQEGFNVVHIGNHIDFGAEKTIIFYRPGAEKMARNLRAKFFSNSAMEQSAKLSEDVAVKLLLGKDLLQRTETMAKLND
ncbi:MAG: LytR C-terminal domain-containing protein [Deltaproteobacteria bacterium]|nr:LytR C-terminal domain-containing protein [Deltaproteobacteria bacterium]